MTREEAIRIIEKEIHIDVRYCTHEDVCRFEDALRMAIAALREQPRWISVDERLPERGEKVLCYMNFLNKDETIQWGNCITENRYDGVLVGSNPKKHVWEWQGDFVTHWMPLPEPPTEEEV